MSAPPPLPAPPPPLRPNLAHAFGGIWRLTWRRFTGGTQLAILAVMIAALLLLTFVIIHEGDRNAFFNWVISFYLMAVVPIIAFVSGGGTVRDDMKPGTVDYLLTRPMRRTAFLVARFTSHLVCLQLIHLVVLGGLTGVGWFRGISAAVPEFPLLLLAQVVTITAFLAMGYVCGAFTSRYLVLGIAYAGIVEMGLGNIPIQLSKLSVLRHVKGLLIEQFPAAFGTSVASQGAFVTVVVALLFVAVWLAAAAVLFSVQEFAGQRPKDA